MVSYPMEEHASNAEGTELAAYPTPTISETFSEPLEKSRDRKAFLKNLWPKQISLLVELRVRRDHLANERTFLAWLRTSLALSMTGIFTTQFFVLQTTHPSQTTMSFFLLGVPLGSLCQAAALINVVVGACRFWRHQNAMMKGRACTGGWEILLIGGLIALVSACQLRQTTLLTKPSPNRSFCRSSFFSSSAAPIDMRRERCSEL